MNTGMLNSNATPADQVANSTEHGQEQEPSEDRLALLGPT